MTLLALGLCLVPLVVDSLVNRQRVEPSTIVIAWLLPINVGLVLLEEYENAALFSLISATVPVGYSVSGASRTPTSDRPIAPLSPSEVRAARNAVFAVAIALTIYHYSVVGVPLFSSQVELARWNFTGSGLFGLPGRMMLFAVPLLTAFSLVDLGRRTPFGVTLITAGVLLSVASGFKGALLSLSVSILMVATVVGGGVEYKRALRRYAPAFAGSLLTAIALLSLYSDFVRVSGTTSSSVAVFERATVSPALVADHVLDLRSTGNTLGIDSPAFVFDSETLLRRYAGLPESGNIQVIRVVSASFRGLDPRNDVLIVPSTPTGPALVFFEYGMWAFPIVALSGYLIGRLVRFARGAGHRSPNTLVAAGLILAFFDFFAKGDLAFPLINWAAVSILTTALYVAALSLQSRLRIRRFHHAYGMPDTSGVVTVNE